MSTSSRPIDVHYRNVKSLEGKGGKIAFREFRGAHQDGIDGRLMDRINERFFKKGWPRDDINDGSVLVDTLCIQSELN